MGSPVFPPQVHRTRRSGGLTRLLLTVWVSLPLSLGAAAEPISEGGLVDYQNGALSVAFEQTPVEVAFEAIRAKTGIEVILPAAARGKSLTVGVARLPLQAAFRQILRALGLESFAIVYEEDGSASKLIVLASGEGEPPPGPMVPPTAPPGSLLPAPGVPVYIPPVSEPVYIPPATPPQYIPPREEPLSILPAN